MQIVLADDDAFSRELLVRTLQARTAHRVTAVEDGHQALDLVLSDNPPDALLLDWMMPTMTGTEVCRRVRAAPLARQPYILLVTAKNQRDELIEGLRVGADDLLTKPVPADVLVARIRSAELQRRGRSSSHVLRALSDARAEANGQLVIRNGEVTASVYFHEGAVAWAHISDDRNTLFELLSSEVGLDVESARAIVQECRQTGARLSDTLERWGLTDRASLRNSLQLWIRKKLETIVRFDQAQTLFLPQRRGYAEDMLFELAEVAPELETAGSLAPGPSLPPAAESAWEDSFLTGETDVETASILERCMASEGVRGVAVLNRERGSCLGRRGAPLNPHIVWALLQSTNVVARHASLEDAVVVTPPDYHLLRLLKSRPNCFVYAWVNGGNELLGAARFALSRAVRADGPAPARS